MSGGRGRLPSPRRALEGAPYAPTALAQYALPVAGRASPGHLLFKGPSPGATFLATGVVEQSGAAHMPETMTGAAQGPRDGATMPDSAVIIPALNEEGALRVLLQALPIKRLHSVVVVDNGSTDATARIAQNAGATVVAEPKTGYGAACLKGLAHLSALDVPPRSVVFMDADHAECANKIPVLLGALESGADLALGVRIRPSGLTGNRRLHARWGNRLILFGVALLFGRRFRDLPPFRAIRAGALASLAMDDRNWGWTLQMQVRAALLRLTIHEVPIPHHPRRHGHSKISGRLGPSLRVGATMVRTLLRERFGSITASGAKRWPPPGPPSRPPSPGDR